MSSTCRSCNGHGVRISYRAGQRRTEDCPAPGCPGDQFSLNPGATDPMSSKVL